MDEDTKTLVGMVSLATVATPIGAYIGSYIGEGTGWVWGNLIDFVPYVKSIAPWLAERAGLVNDPTSVSNLNEDLYQAMGSLSGFYGGAALPWKVIFGASSAKKTY